MRRDVRLRLWMSGTCMVLSVIIAGCGRSGQGQTVSTSPSPLPKSSQSPTPITGKSLFVDVAQKAGLQFTHDSGATGKFWYIENTPPGVALFDYNNDGWLDAFLVQSGSSEPLEQVKNRPPCALFHNNGDGTFRNITAGSGLDTDISTNSRQEIAGHGQGVAIGDYDNDGFSDILVTAYDRCRLFRNERGTGRFTDVTETTGIGKHRGYFTSAAFGDYDNDGRLDLYVCRYGPWNWKTNIPCQDSLGLDYCTPIVYDPDKHLLLHNEGNRFRDVSDSSGIAKEAGRGLGVAFLDYDKDGRQDIFVANDLTPNRLWHNNGDGTFTDRGLVAGCAFDSSGQVMAGMGVAVGDYDRSGNDSLFVGNFSDKPNMLFKNVGGGLFEDRSYTSGVALAHMKFLTFGTEFFDYDADGWLDLFVVNGHVKMTVDQQSAGVTYKERKQLFRNTGTGTFAEVTDPAELGSLRNSTVGRGLAIGDYDNDGRLDALIGNQNGATELLHNQAKSGNHWVSFLTVGTKSNREGRHARLTLTAGGMTQTATVRAGSSYLSSSDRRVYFGLGKADRIEKVIVRWPSGTKDTLNNLAPDKIYTLTEGKGILSP